MAIANGYLGKNLILLIPMSSAPKTRPRMILSDYISPPMALQLNGLLNPCSLSIRLYGHDFAMRKSLTPG